MQDSNFNPLLELVPLMKALTPLPHLVKQNTQYMGGYQEAIFFNDLEKIVCFSRNLVSRIPGCWCVGFYLRFPILG